MLQTSSSPQPIPSTPPEPLGTQRRVDSAHPPIRPPESNEGGESDDDLAGQRAVTLPPAVTTRVDVQQLEHHAEQLAEFLRLKQRDLDRREAQLNAQFGTWEQAERAGRFQLDERRQTLDEREFHVVRREAELARRTAALAAAEVASEQAAASAKQLDDRRAAELDVREQRLVEREQQIKAQQEKIKDAEQRLKTSQQKWQQQITCEHQQLMVRRAELQQQQRLLLQNVEHQREALQQREMQLVGATQPAAAELESPPEPKTKEEKPAQTDHQDDHRPAPSVNELQRSLAEPMTEDSEPMRSLEQERELWIAQKTLKERELDERATAQRLRLEEREQRLRQQRQSLERLRRTLAVERHEALKIHGETLELRLTIEHLWSQLSALADPAVISSTLERLRSELQKHYALQRQEIQQLLAKSHVAAEQLDGQQRRLDAGRKKWHSWLTAQRKNLETRAAQLDSRQRQIDAQQARFKRLDLGQSMLVGPPRTAGSGYNSSSISNRGTAHEPRGRCSADPPTKTEIVAQTFLPKP
jgi:hypothetical protein